MVTGYFVYDYGREFSHSGDLTRHCIYCVGHPPEFCRKYDKIFHQAGNFSNTVQVKFVLQWQHACQEW